MRTRGVDTVRGHDDVRQAFVSMFRNPTPRSPRQSLPCSQAWSRSLGAGPVQRRTRAASSTTIAAASSGASAVGAQAADVLATSATMASDAYAAALRRREDAATGRRRVRRRPVRRQPRCRPSGVARRPPGVHPHRGLPVLERPDRRRRRRTSRASSTRGRSTRSYVDELIAGERRRSPRETLRADNEHGGERNISTGWHAIEYLLWGVDDDPAGPGDRPASDFAGDAADADAMREYLSRSRPRCSSPTSAPVLDAVGAGAGPVPRRVRRAAAGRGPAPGA